MVYATYEYYCEKYGGVAISDDNVFRHFARKASAYIDKFTFGRINEGNVSTFPSLSPCVCDMAETIFFELGEKGDKKEKKQYGCTFSLS